MQSRRRLPFPLHAHRTQRRRKNRGHIDYDDSLGALLQTSVSGTLEPVTQASIRKALWRYPAMTLGVVFHIHLQALRLWVKRVKFFSKPTPPDAFVTK